MIDFIAVGPQRTASSWLDRALRSHPELFLPVHVKETFYFDHYFHRGPGWYSGLFDQTNQRGLKGEVGSTYFESLRAREHIKKHNSRARIIIMVRNPVARTFSSFGHEYAKGRVGGDFFQAITQQPRILESGRYALHAPKWENDFGADNVFYLVQEDIEAEPQTQLDLVCEFLGVQVFQLPSELHSRYGQRTLPRFRLLAAVASRAATVLRRAGLHKTVEAGKRLGLNRVYSGRNPSVLAMTYPVFEFLLREHETDMIYLEACLGRRFPHWRDPSTYGL